MSNESSNPVDIAKRAKAAFETSQLIDSSERVKALHLIKDELELLKNEIQDANKADMEVSSFLLLGPDCPSFLSPSSLHYSFWSVDSVTNRLHKKKSKQDVYLLR